jgi:tRNA threonylcarbamoyladenosine biosynthesis protein TsaE
MILDESGLKEYGRKLGETLGSGAVVALVGDLGTGKTTLAQAIAIGLGVTEPVTSPTFTIICEYFSGRLPFYHFDVYRLSDAAEAEMEELGWDEYFYGKGVTVVEWADMVEGILPPDAMRIHLAYGAEPDQRVLEVAQPGQAD